MQILRAKAVMAAPDQSKEKKEVSSLDIIFSCGVCQATISEIYKTKEKLKHFSDGINPRDHIVTKFWLTDCAHLTCGKHLEGGGAPFHPDGQHPRAPCPVCKADNGDETPKALYSIRGFGPGEYDDKIPRSWFHSPPVKLDTGTDSMEALRFHYLSLLRYGTQMHTKDKRVMGLFDEAESEIEKFAKSLANKDNKILSLTEDVERYTRTLETKDNIIVLLEDEVRRLQGDLDQWKERQPSITQYLRLMPKLVDENERLKETIRSLGYEPPNMTYNLDQPSKDIDRSDAAVGDRAARNENTGRSRGWYHPSMTASSRTISGSAKTPRVADLEPIEESPVRRVAKRLRPSSSESALRARLRELGESSSRSMLPPTQPPPSRTPKKPRLAEIPTAVRQNAERPEADVQVYEGGNWQDVDQPVQPQRQPSAFTQAGNGAYVSVDSPEASSLLDTRRPSQSSLLVRMRPEANNDYPANPISEGFSSPNVGRMLQDPRQSQLLPDPRVQPEIYINDAPAQMQSYTGRPPLSHPFFNQTVRGEGLRGHHPRDRRQEDPALLSSSYPPQRAWNPITPARKRGQTSIRPESVTSPFFRSSSRAGQYQARSGTSAGQSASVRSQPDIRRRYTMAPAQPRLLEHNSLNGLSFIDSPQNASNAPIRESDYEMSRHRTYQQPLPTINRDALGYFVRPGPRDEPYTRQPSPFIAAPSHPRQQYAVPLPSATPSIVPMQRTSLGSLREASRHEALAPTGVRSSTQTGTSHNPYVQSNRTSGLGASSTQSRGLFASTGGRRSVRR